MRKRHGALWVGLLVAAPLVLTGCGSGGEGAEEGSPEPEAEPTETTDARAAMAECLDDAGVETVTTGDLPIVASAEGIGILLPGPRNLEPGPVSAAVFVYDTDAEAQEAVDSLAGFAGAATAVGNVAVMWGGEADPETLDAISGCVP